jgi:PA14 domain
VHDQKLDFDWGESSPTTNVPAMGWSARVTGDFTAPESALYRLAVGGDEDVRIFIDGKPITNLMVNNREQRVVDWKFESGKVYEIAIEYHRRERGEAELHLNMSRLEPGKPGSDWVTRLTPMNFYPLSAGAADKVRAEKTLAWMYREDKFWLPWICPRSQRTIPSGTNKFIDTGTSGRRRTILFGSGSKAMQTGHTRWSSRDEMFRCSCETGTTSAFAARTTKAPTVRAVTNLTTVGAHY